MRNFYSSESESNEKENKIKQENIKKIIKWGLIGVVVLILFFGCFRVIGATEVGVRVTLGSISPNPSYGLSVKFPFISKFVKFDKTTQRIESTDQAYTKDIQTADIKYVFTYKIYSGNAPKLYKSAGRDYQDKLVYPVLHAILKDVVGHWIAQDLVGSREEATKEITEKLQKSLDSTFFYDISFQMADIGYSKNFETSIEEKVMAEQEALKAKNRTAQVEEEAKQAVIRAKGDADAKVAEAEGNARAIAVEGKALQENSIVLKLRQIEVQGRAAEAAKGWHTVVMSSNQTKNFLGIGEE